MLIIQSGHIQFKGETHQMSSWQLENGKSTVEFKIRVLVILFESLST